MADQREPAVVARDRPAGELVRRSAPSPLSRSPGRSRGPQSGAAVAVGALPAPRPDRPRRRSATRSDATRRGQYPPPRPTVKPKLEDRAGDAPGPSFRTLCRGRRPRTNEGRGAVDGVEADHPSGEAAGHLGRQVPTVEPGQRLERTVRASQPRWSSSGSGGEGIRVVVRMRRAPPEPSGPPGPGGPRPPAVRCALTMHLAVADLDLVVVVLVDAHRRARLGRFRPVDQGGPGRTGCCWRRPTNLTSRSSRPTPPPRRRSHPGGQSSTSLGRGRRTETHCGGSPPSKSSRAGFDRRPAGHGGVGHVEPSSPTTGQPSTQATGTRKVSRPSTWNPASPPLGRDPEQHHPPRAVGRLDEVGVAGVLDRLVGAAVAEDRVGRAALPTGRSATGPGRSTPRGRGRCRPRRSAGTTVALADRCGASGNCNPVPDQGARARPAPRRSGRRSGSGDGAHARSGPSRCRRRPTRGRGRCPAALRAPGPTTARPGRRRSRRSCQAALALAMTVVIIQRRPSWWRMVGANTPADVEPSVVDRSSCDGRSSVADLGPGHEVRRAEDRDAGEVREPRRRQEVAVADTAHARVGVEPGDDRVPVARAHPPMLALTCAGQPGYCGGSEGPVEPDVLAVEVVVAHDRLDEQRNSSGRPIRLGKMMLETRPSRTASDA